MTIHVQQKHYLDSGRMVNNRNIPTRCPVACAIVEALGLDIGDVWVSKVDTQIFATYNIKIPHYSFLEDKIFAIDETNYKEPFSFYLPISKLYEPDE